MKEIITPPRRKYDSHYGRKKCKQSYRIVSSLVNFIFKLNIQIKYNEVNNVQG